MLAPRRPSSLTPGEIAAIRAAAASEFAANPPAPGSPRQLAVAEQVMAPAVRAVQAERENVA